MWGIHLELMCATFSFWGSYLLCYFKLWLLRFFYLWDMSKPWMFCLCYILSSVIRRVLGYASENVCQCKCALLFTQVVMWENHKLIDKKFAHSSCFSSAFSQLCTQPESWNQWAFYCPDKNSSAVRRQSFSKKYSIHLRSPLTKPKCQHTKRHTHKLSHSSGTYAALIISVCPILLVKITDIKGIVILQ